MPALRRRLWGASPAAATVGVRFCVCQCVRVFHVFCDVLNVSYKHDIMKDTICSLVVRRVGGSGGGGGIMGRWIH